MGLSDAGRARDRDDLPRSALAGERAGEECRRLLTGLISPLCKAESAATADLLVEEFGSLARILAAEPERISTGLQDRPALAEFLTLLGTAMKHALRAELFARPILGDAAAVLSYARLTMAYEAAEQLRIFYLNGQNRLLQEEVASRGGVDEAPIYPREIMRRALLLGATALILVHNHPSDDLQPSKGDITATREIADAARCLGIRIHDHLIVAASGAASFRMLGLL